MSVQRRTAVFKLKGKSPQDLPIDRLAQYMRALADLLGSSEKVRLSGLKAGSVEFGLAVDALHYPVLIERITTASNRDRASSTVRKAITQIEAMITEDGVTAEFRAGRTRLLHLHGYSRENGVILGPLAQPFTVRGRIIGLEGKDATKHVRLQEYGTGREFRGDFRRDDLGRKLARYLWGEVVELSGAARLLRYPDGIWQLQSFHIEDVVELDASSVSDVMHAMRDPLSAPSLKRRGGTRIDKLRN